MRIITALFLIALSLPASAQTNDALRDIDAFAASVVRTLPEVPSVAVAVVQNGKRHVTAAGYADLANKVPATPKTGYYVGSTTKAFTGLAAAILAERKQLDLDAPLARYLPDAKFSDAIDARRLTLRHLLSHTGPLENFPITFRTAFSGEHTPELLVRMLADSKPRDPAFRYDNLGYVIAGLAFQRATGRTWQQLHDDLVFEPLGMKHATAYMSEAVKRGGMALPYEVLSSGNVELLTYRKNDQMMHAAGGTVMTAEDLARWLEANLTGGKIGGRRIISASAIAEIQKAQVTIEKPRAPFAGTAYGFGWYRGTHGADTLLFHGGGFEGWRALFTAMPERNLAVGVLTNVGFGNPVNHLIVSYAYDRLLNKPDVEKEYAEKLSRLRAELDRQKASVVADAQKRAQRQWRLEHERSAYAGRYENAKYGTLTIAERDGKLYASIGTMHAALEPFTDPESARVELIPASGETLHFTFGDGPRPVSLKYKDEVFIRK